MQTFCVFNICFLRYKCIYFINYVQTPSPPRLLISVCTALLFRLTFILQPTSNIRLLISSSWDEDWEEDSFSKTERARLIECGFSMMLVGFPFTFTPFIFSSRTAYSRFICQAATPLTCFPAQRCDKYLPGCYVTPNVFSTVTSKHYFWPIYCN